MRDATGGHGVGWRDATAIRHARPCSCLSHGGREERGFATCGGRMSDSACSCWRFTARPALTTSVAQYTVNECATSWQDSTIIVPVSVCHHGSCAEGYSKCILP